MVSNQPRPSGATRPARPSLDLPYYGIGFVDAVKRGFKKYATFTGRASCASIGGGRCSPSPDTSCSVCWRSLSARQPHETGVGILHSSRCR